jgi:peptidoglycan lytic transglycosylase F
MRDRSTARWSMRRRFPGVIVTALILTSCTPAPEPAPQEQPGKLVVLLRAGPTTWFPGVDGLPAGIDHDLLTRFAREQHVELEMREASGVDAIFDSVARGEVHVGAGGLFLGSQARPSGTDRPPPPLLWTTGYHAVEPVLIYAADGFVPRSFRDLDGATIAYVEHTGVDAAVADARARHREIVWQAVDVPSTDALIAQVSEGVIDYAVVASTDAAVARSIYLDFDVGFAIGPSRELAFAVAPGRTALRDALDLYLARLRKNGELARYAERYFARARQVARVDATAFLEKVRTVLPDLRALFEEAQTVSGVDWRLIAAIAYQESQWDPGATSDTGVRGMMQLTEETARHLGVGDRLDTRASTLAAARYFADLRDKLPARIAEPDRTWLALAAFNIGLGHLEDARVLAQSQKLDPDRWSDVRKALPLLAEPEYSIKAKNGYARGGMPVAHVDRVRGYFDILLRTQPAPKPRLTRATESERDRAGIRVPAELR